MSGVGPEAVRSPGPNAAVALAIATIGIVGCVVAFAFAEHDQLAEPLAIALVLCVIASSFVTLDIEGSLFWSGAAIPHVCAFALLGPAPAGAITAVEEVSVWAVERYRLRMFPINLFATTAPNMLAAYVMQAVTGPEPVYYVVLATVASGAITLNFCLVTALVGLFYGEPVRERLARHRRLAAPLALNLAVALGAVALYRESGLASVVFIAAGVLIFAYVTRRLALEREQSARISELADSRGRLVAQLLEAEDRERKALAQILHDDIVQLLLVIRQDLEDIEGSSDGLREPIQHLNEVTNRLRGTIRSTHPSVLEHVGLEAAMSMVAELYAAGGRFRTTVNLALPGPGPYDRLLFTAARELLANASKHANATQVDVSLTATARAVVLRVSDDGCGFTYDPTHSGLGEGHIGLPTLQERVEAVGGELRVSPGSHSRGTEVFIELPRHAQATLAGARDLS